MTTRIHIERLVVDEGVLSARDILGFTAAVSAELTRLRAGAAEAPTAALSEWHAAAQRTAVAIHGRMPAPPGRGRGR